MTKRRLDQLYRDADERYPLVGDTLGELRVSSDIPNYESIDASLSEYKILPGIREVLTSDFDADPKDMYYARDDRVRCVQLAQQIAISGWIAPLIVVIDDHGPYILEGGHRLGAMFLSSIESFPALVVVGE